VRVKADRRALGLMPAGADDGDEGQAAGSDDQHIRQSITEATHPLSNPGVLRCLRPGRAMYPRSKVLVQMVALRGARIFPAKAAAALQFGDHQVDEFLDRTGTI